ncbi:hypothetical protein NDU88_002720 [Pleurodeles waltl]|uniref:Uncharacterized protein n=1 Tax=Pleurodeles waltl TaxID=8319 RepID=A0AAV7TMK5_PLEWA|nr:hypothetical protein NDU88_002720 [Pleurodeles waltl]
MSAVTQLDAMPCAHLKWLQPDLYGETSGNEIIPLALCALAVGGRRPPRKFALVNVGRYGYQEPTAMYWVGDGEDLHCKCCCDLSGSDNGSSVRGKGPCLHFGGVQETGG